MLTETDIRTTTRTRTFTWEDPLPALAQAAGMSGLDYMQAMVAGEVPPPPIAKTMDFELGEIREGHASLAVVPQEWHYNPIGMVHGGVAATLLDTVLGVSIHTTLDAGQAYSTVDLHLQYLRPVTIDTGRVTAAADVVHRGRRIATAEGKLTDERGRILASAITTCVIL